MQTEMANLSEDRKRYGCGVLEFYGGVLRKKGFWPRRSASNVSVSIKNGGVDKLGNSNSKRRRGGSDEASFLANDAAILVEPPKLAEKSATNNTEKAPAFTLTRSPLDQKTNPPQQQKFIVTRTPPSTNVVNQAGDAGLVRKSSDSISCGSSGSTVTKAAQSPTKSNLVKRGSTISGELETTIAEYRSKPANPGSTLVRASSNVCVLGYLGNLKQPVTANYSAVTENQTRTAKEPNSKYGNGIGNIVKRNGNGNSRSENENSSEAPVFCRALSKRMDPEELKGAGNEEYKKGKFAEALALYDRAIALDPDRASYRSNKSAALTGLGRLIEAVAECKEAIRIEPSYSRAHHRLANLYLRLGEPEKSLDHYKLSGSESNASEIAQAQAAQTHLAKCTEARKLRDWHTMLKETNSAINAGVDSAPQVFASQSEVFLKLHRPQEAEAALANAPAFELDAVARFHGMVGNVYLLLIRAQIDLVSGRFESAVSTAQRAARLDSNNKEVGSVLRKARALSLARSNGNELFKASKFSEACAVYGEGLDLDPLNAVLLCNRAACRSKLGQWEKAIEDCTAALNVRPSYSKARLRRADCNAKLERWEASIQDYEALIRETPGDAEVGKALFEAQLQLKKQRGEDVKDMKFGAQVVVISSSERFRQFVTGPGMSVVLFCTKSSEQCMQITLLMEQLCKGYPSVNFLKVDTGDNPFLAKLENVNSLPCFKIYKNGSKVKEIAGNNQELLESSVKYFST